jgi:hypothetical protein
LEPLQGGEGGSVGPAGGRFLRQDPFIGEVKEVEVEVLTGEGVPDLGYHPVHILVLEVEDGDVGYGGAHPPDEFVGLVQDGRGFQRPAACEVARPGDEIGGETAYAAIEIDAD